MNLNNKPAHIEIVEVAPRDGFQSIVEPLPTISKIKCVQALIDAGITRIEIGSFVSPKAIPQMADINAIAKAFINTPNIRFAALVPNSKGAELALQAGIRELVYVVSVSETHNLKNVRQNIVESLQGLSAVAEQLLKLKSALAPALRLDLGTSFDCPYEGTISWPQVNSVVNQALAITKGLDLEIALCDTTGKATPYQVADHLTRLREQPEREHIRWAFHGHDTYGMGVSNALFAIHHGATALDAAAAGLGGCPFAPGASGNTATEGIVYALHKSGIHTGIDMQQLLIAADYISDLPGGQTDSRIRTIPRRQIVD
jgi:hydroxymethylglutaryl-CoA lyase